VSAVVAIIIIITTDIAAGTAGMLVMVMSADIAAADGPQKPMHFYLVG
jgi:hypothetical protein